MSNIGNERILENIDGSAETWLRFKYDLHDLVPFVQYKKGENQPWRKTYTHGRINTCAINELCLFMT